MIFEQVATGGCQSYLIGCSDTCAAAVIDPEVRQIERYKALAAHHGVRIRYVIDTHTHADHFSAAKQLSEQLGAPAVAHRLSPAPYPDLRVDEGDVIKVGNIRLAVLHTPGHTRDAMCLVASDRVFTGDTLLIGATGRTDLPTGDPEQLYDSLFNKLLKLDPQMKIYPAHVYKGHSCSTIEEERRSNPRLQKTDRAEFVEMMRTLSLSMPEHLTEALRVNMSGAVSVAQMLSEAAAEVPFMSMDEVKARAEAGANDLIVLDVREKDAFEAGHIPNARHLPRGVLELKVNEALPDPTARIVTYCEYGKISTLAAATLRKLGFTRAVALDGGMKAWREKGFPVEPS
ncbi:MAG TPA: rhodanese-like domain-containing protein [Vitreimonas sp.]|uniref:MBL fold metallo-hydrolase n=1 Tax=Vitreimonas sp. TaxID=3069702 RepID=UPI002D72A877|nr:rhodanese-like domain-containing protein [Vitreimonas sp.]HYD88741.1 rhodanese-like domain-containing protein [Vitreimonas sp.]